MRRKWFEFCQLSTTAGRHCRTISCLNLDNIPAISGIKRWHCRRVVVFRPTASFPVFATQASKPIETSYSISCFPCCTQSISLILTWSTTHCSAPFLASITILHRPHYHTVGRPSTDSRPTVVLATDYRSTVGRLSVTKCRPTVGWPIGRPSTDCRPTVGRLSVDGQPTVGRQSVDSRSTVSRQSVDGSVDCRPTVDRQGAKVHMIQEDDYERKGAWALRISGVSVATTSVSLPWNLLAAAIVGSSVGRIGAKGKYNKRAAPPRNLRQVLTLELDSRIDIARYCCRYFTKRWLHSLTLNCYEWGYSLSGVKNKWRTLFVGFHELYKVRERLETSELAYMKNAATKKIYIIRCGCLSACISLPIAINFHLVALHSSGWGDSCMFVRRLVEFRRNIGN